MLDLALHDGKGPVLLRDIAERQKVSEKYLWHLIAPLKNSGLVISKRGVHGGYELAKSSKNITLYDIVAILEGPLGLVECVKDSSVCDCFEACVTTEIWKEVSQGLRNTLNKITLEDMVKKYHKKAKILEYVI